MNFSSQPGRNCDQLYISYDIQVVIFCDNNLDEFLSTAWTQL